MQTPAPGVIDFVMVLDTSTKKIILCIKAQEENTFREDKKGLTQHIRFTFDTYYKLFFFSLHYKIKILSFYTVFSSYYIVFETLIKSTYL